MDKDKQNLIEKVKQLRAETGAGWMDCRKALEEAEGDLEQARRILKAKGVQIAQKKAHREAREGLIEAYIHFSGRFGALVEVNCETDFVARTPEFKRLAQEIALQVAGMNPRYVSRDQIPEEEVHRLRQEFEETVAASLPPETRDSAWERYLERFYAEHCLLDQPLVRDQTQTVRDLITEAIARLGENIVVRRFVRFELGE